MSMGFNTDIKHDGVVYHIQTELRKDLRIETLVYLAGAIIHARRISYQELRNSSDYSEEKLARFLKDQHQQVIAQIRAGEIKPPGAVPSAAGPGGRLITIHLNGETQEVPEGLTLATLLEWLKLAPDRVAIERNLEIVPRGHWRETPVQTGDRLEVVQFVGGGSES